MSLRIILIPLALVAALALALLAFQVGRAPAPEVQAEAPPPPPVQLNVLVAARPLSPGMLIRDEDFTPKAMPQRDAPAGSLPDTPEIRTEIRGALLRHFIDPGMAVTRADILRARDRGFLAAVLDPGTRAVSIPVDAVTGVSGLIWPGDRVDVILTQEMDGQQVPLSRRVFGETVLTDVRVIAVDQQITEGGIPASGGEGVGRVAHTITLQVAVDQAERVTVAGRMGHLALAVRAVEVAPNGSAQAGVKTVFGGDVSPELSASTRRTGTHMRLIQGDRREEITFQ